MSPKKRCLTDQDREIVLRMAREGASNTEIARVIGFSTGPVSRLRNEHGLGGDLSVQTELSEAQMAEIIGRYRAGEGASKLGREYHVSPPRLQLLLRERGLRLRSNERDEATKAEVRHLHEHSDLFSHEIQERCNVSETAYTQWTRGLKRLNAPKQTNPMVGRHFYDVWIERYGQVEADARMDAFRAQCGRRCKGKGNPMYGRASPQGAGNGWKGWYGDHFFRSLRELSFMLACDRDGVKWTSGETLSIRYDANGTARTYRPDFLCGRRVIELKPLKLISTPAVLAKTAGAQAYCAAHGLTYEIYDCGIDLELIQHAYEAGLVTFTGGYAERFEAFLTGSAWLPTQGTSETDAA